MRFTLTIDMGNAAFESPSDELDHILARVLADVNDAFDDGLIPDRRPVLDFNGNTVGSWEITS